MNMDMYDFTKLEGELLDLGKHPQAEAYFELAYSAITEGNNDLAREYLLKTEEAIRKGFALTILNGQKPLDEYYDCCKRAVLKVVP